MPICPSLAPRSWWQAQGLVPVAPELILQEQVWLLLPEDLQAPAAAKATLQVIERRAFRAVAQGDGALLKEPGFAAAADEELGRESQSSGQLPPGSVHTDLGSERRAGRNSGKATKYAADA